MIDYEKITEKVRVYTKDHVKKTRFEHSVRVAEMTAKLCKMYSLDEKKGYLAGIGHDMCKDFSDKKMIKLAKKDGNDISEIELKNIHLLHGRAAAIMFKKKFKVKDNELLEAVANHTSGFLGMSDFSKCLYIADKIEPGRPQSTDEYRNKLLSMDLNHLFYFVLKENYDYIVKKGYTMYSDTLKMIEYYKPEDIK